MFKSILTVEQKDSFGDIAIAKVYNDNDSVAYLSYRGIKKAVCYKHSWHQPREKLVKRELQLFMRKVRISQE